MISSSLISFIVPVYNGELYIKRCLHSICSQTYLNIEVVVVDDGSTDETINIINECATLDTRIRCFVQKNSGVSAARNYALTKIRGEYVAFVDADDWIAPGFVDYNYSIMSQMKADMVINDFYYNRPNSESVSSTFECEKGELCVDYVKRLLIVSDKMNSPCISLYSVAIINHNHIVFPEDISCGEDIIFNLKYIDYVKKPVYTKKAFYHYEIHDGSGCRRLHEKQLEMYDIQLELKISYGNKWNALDKKRLVALIGTQLASFSLLAEKGKSYCDYKQWMKEVYRSKQYDLLINNVNLVSYCNIPKTYRILVRLIASRLDCGSYIYCKLINCLLGHR